MNFVACQLVSVFPSKSGCQAGSLALPVCAPVSARTTQGSISHADTTTTEARAAQARRAIVVAAIHQD